MSTRLDILAKLPLPDGFPGAARDENAPFWARVSIEVRPFEDEARNDPRLRALAKAQGGAVEVVRLEAPARAGEFMLEYGEVLLRATGGTMIINGKPQPQAAAPDPEFRTAEAIRAGLLARDLWLFTDEDYSPDGQLLGEGREGRVTVLMRREVAPGAESPPAPEGVEVTTVPLDDDWARRNLVHLGQVFTSDAGPRGMTAAWYRAELGRFVPRVVEIRARDARDERAMSLASSVAREIAEASGGALIHDDGRVERRV